MDPTNLQRFQAEAIEARHEAERNELPRGSDPVWGVSHAAIYESMADVAEHLSVIAASFPHAEGLARQEISRLTDAVTGLYVGLTEPPVCAAESPESVDAAGRVVATECERRSGHAGDHDPRPPERVAIDAATRVLNGALMLNDVVRSVVLEGNAPDAADRAIVARLIEQTTEQLHGVARQFGLQPAPGSSALVPPQSERTPGINMGFGFER